MNEQEQKTRTIKQNSALHQLFEELANELNLRGLDMRTVLKPGIDIPWTKETVKEHLWKKIQKIAVNKEHTSELSSQEIDLVFSILSKHLGEKFGIELTFPSVNETE